ncbi:MAG: hypothetical protein Q4B08_14215 [Propionibacteriaceae bacterium]|nr:hypothetical protein [Propionibacteriaceae bacterium]
MPPLRAKVFRHPAELPLFIIGVIVTLTCYAVAISIWWLPEDEFQALAELPEIVDFLAALVFLPLGLTILRGIAAARTRITAVRVDEHNFPDILHIQQELCERANIPVTPLYVTWSSDLQLCSTDRAERSYLAVSTDAISGARDHDPAALRYLVAHELGHQIAGHQKKLRAFAANLMVETPVIGYFLTRAREYTADRFAHMVLEADAVQAGYRLITIGKDQFANIRYEDIVRRASAERGNYVLMANLGATIPPVTWRAYAAEHPRQAGRLLWPPRH